MIDYLFFDLTNEQTIEGSEICELLMILRADMSVARKLLQAPGDVLHVRSQGYGNISYFLNVIDRIKVRTGDQRKAVHCHASVRGPLASWSTVG